MAEWRVRLAELAGRLDGVPVNELEKWMGDEKLRPVDARGKAPARAEDDESVLARTADPGEMLAGLLGEEEEELSAAERDELARALERGDALDDGQRLAAAGLLRGSGVAARAEVLRRLVEFIVPEEEDGTRTRVWEVKDRTLHVPEGAKVVRVESGMVIAGWPTLGSYHMVVYDAEGRLFAGRMLSGMKKLRPLASGGLELKYRQLVPTGVYASEKVSRRLAVVESLLHPERSHEGKRLAAMLGVSEPAVHYQRKNLLGKVNAATGGRAGIAGMRNKDQRNKGVKRERGAA